MREVGSLDLETFILSSSIQSRLARVLGAFAFFVGMDQALGRFKIDLLERWGVSPINATLAFIVFAFFVELVFFPRTITSSGETSSAEDENARFSSEVLEFARYLKSTHRNGPLLDLRDSMSHFLHLMAAHQIRCDLGELALSAAVAVGSELHRAQILIDDLGWAKYALGDKRGASRNILRGIAIAETVRPEDSLYISNLIVAAKGHRHLAFMTDDSGEQEVHLSSSEKALTNIMKQFNGTTEIQRTLAREQAQLTHARALLLAQRLGIAKSGYLSPDDYSAVAQAERALSLLEQSATQFRYANDRERMAKALKLKERLEIALGRQTEAIETRAQIGGVLRIEESKR